MVTLLIIAAANLIIGTFIGLCGVAGFLLPMLYTGFLGMDVKSSLALSFLAFLVSGLLGSYNYHRAGNLNLKFSFLLGAGSLAGSIVGVYLNSRLPSAQVKQLLYIVVLLSGISILLRERAAKTAPGSDGGGHGSHSGLLDSKGFVLGFGIITAAICSLSGAGGPVLVMPLLVSLGMDVRVAVGTALFDSVFIALPAIGGYMMASQIEQLPLLIAIIILFHGIGVLIGSKHAERIPARPLKLGVAVFSVALAVYMIGGSFFLR